jgi:ribokinase
MAPRVAVVGHVEWVELARVPHVPRRGEIVNAAEWWQEAAGGGAVAAVQVAKLAGEADFFTALAEDEHGARAHTRLEELGVRVHAASRPAPQRRGFVHLDGGGERTITTLGDRIAASGDDDLPWDRLDGADAVYFMAGDAGALRAARRARRLVANPRAGDALQTAGVQLDVLVRSGTDPGERHAAEDLEPQPRFTVTTAGHEGGRWLGADGTSGAWKAAELPGPRRDSYGAGDSFAGGLTYGLGAGLSLTEALRVGALCGAYKLAGRAMYENQLTAPEL